MTPRPPGKPPTPAPKRILIVDDESFISDLASFYLQERGFETVTLNDPRKVEAAMAKRAFDLLILDHMMPYVMGMSLAERLREDPRHKRIPILLVTGKFITVEDRERCLKAGISIFAKPITSLGLFDKISQLLEKP